MSDYYCGLDCRSYRPGGKCVNPKRKGVDTGFLSPVCNQFDNKALPAGSPVKVERLKVCMGCCRTLPVSEFARKGRGYRKLCKDCRSQEKQLP